MPVKPTIVGVIERTFYRVGGPAAAVRLPDDRLIMAWNRQHVAVGAKAHAVDLGDGEWAVVDAAEDAA